MIGFPSLRCCSERDCVAIVCHPDPLSCHPFGWSPSLDLNLKSQGAEDKTNGTRKECHYGGLANTSAAFPTCPNCQIGDIDTIWFLLIGSWWCTIEFSFSGPPTWHPARMKTKGVLNLHIVFCSTTCVVFDGCLLVSNLAKHKNFLQLRHSSDFNGSW